MKVTFLQPAGYGYRTTWRCCRCRMWTDHWWRPSSRPSRRSHSLTRYGDKASARCWAQECEERGVRGVRLVALGDRRDGQVGPLWGLHLEGEKVCVKSKSLALDNRTESLWPFLSSAKCLEVPAQVWGRLRPTFFAENFQWTSEKKEIKWMFSRFINGINKFHEWQSSSFFLKH